MKDKDPNRPYMRTEIDEVFNKRKAQMHKEALERGYNFDGQEKAYYIDCYTKNILRGGDRYDYEHIISAEAAFMALRATHTNQEIAEIVNCKENVSVTLRSINQYKGKYDLQSRLLDNESKIKEFGIDVKWAKKNLATAEKAVFKNT